MKRRRSIYNKYGGEILRSLLERRWAVAFDSFGIKWSYEPVRHANSNVSYLPDFYFPQFGFYGEVKPCYPSFRESFSAHSLVGWFRVPLLFMIGDPVENPSFFVVRIHDFGDGEKPYWFHSKSIFEICEEFDGLSFTEKMVGCSGTESQKWADIFTPIEK